MLWAAGFGHQINALLLTLVNSGLPLSILLFLRMHFVKKSKEEQNQAVCKLADVSIELFRHV